MPWLKKIAILRDYYDRNFWPNNAEKASEFGTI